MKKVNKNFNDYLIETKYDLILYFIISIIYLISLSLLYVFLGEAYSFALLFIAIFHFFLTYGKLTCYINVLKIKKYLIENNLEKELNNIIFWNEQNYFLTNNIIVIKTDSKVNHFEYSKIKKIKKETKVRIGKSTSVKEYLVIELTDKTKYKILTWSSSLENEEFKDISDFLLEKNPNIIVSDII